MTFDVIDAGDALRVTFSSSPSLVFRAIAQCEERLRFWGLPGKVELSLVLRELLINAIQHGNRGEAVRSVECSLERVGADGVKIVVEDEGNGFDAGSLDFSVPEDPQHIQKRGLTVVNALADRLEFNTKGNRVTAYLSMRRLDGTRTRQ